MAASKPRQMRQASQASRAGPAGAAPGGEPATPATPLAPRQLPNRRWRRRARLGLVGVSGALVAAGAIGLFNGGPARAEVSPGQGSSYAQSLQVTPHEGSLAVGAVFGEALAGNTYTYARAQSQGLDLGAIGISMKSYNCGQPPQPVIANAVPGPLEVESGEPGAAQGKTDNNPQQTYGATEFAEANNTPYAEADTYYGPLNGTFFAMSGTHSKAWSGIVDGDREAGASSDVAQLSILNGAVVLDGLHWRTVYPSGQPGDEPSGTFSISSATINNTPVPGSELSNMAALAQAINQFLAPVGVQVVMPEVTDVEGLEEVTPLQVEVVPSSTRDKPLDKALTTLEPVYNYLEGGLENGFGSWEPSQLQQALCQSDTPLTVADITLASIDGGGYFNAAVGGVNATDSNLEANPFNLGLLQFSLGTPSFSQTVGSTPATPGTPATPAVPAAPASPLTGSSSGSGSIPAASAMPSSTSATTRTVTEPGRGSYRTASSQGFAPGGPLLALGLSGLGGAGLLAEADRRVMRRAQRNAVFEELES